MIEILLISAAVGVLFWLAMPALIARDLDEEGQDETAN